MEKINIAELLKDCPKGMELDCILFDNDVKVIFDGVDGINTCASIIKIVVIHDNNRISHALTKYGQWNPYKYAKCVIFPKGKTTWEGFQRPFKDGDVLVHTQNERFVMSIYKSNESGIIINTHAIFWDREEGLSVGMQICCYTDSTRFATEEEKQILSQAIKNNGYYWNAETKTLEKLVEPKFKVGDRVRNKNYKDYIYTIHDIVDKGYRAKEIDADYPIIILFGSQEDNYELVSNKFDITTLKPFDKVLVRDTCTQNWRASLFSHCNGLDSYKYKCINGCYTYCIPYEGNEHLLGKTDDCDK